MNNFDYKSVNMKVNYIVTNLLYVLAARVNLIINPKIINFSYFILLYMHIDELYNYNFFFLNQITITKLTFIFNIIVINKMQYFVVVYYHHKM